MQTQAQVDAFVAAADREWGSGGSLRSFAPGKMKDARFRDWWARFERLGATPAAAMGLARMNALIDVRPVLASIRTPTLVIHRRDDARVPLAAGQYLAAHIAGARFVEVEGSDHPMWVGETDTIVDEISRRNSAIDAGTRFCNDFAQCWPSTSWIAIVRPGRRSGSAGARPSRRFGRMCAAGR
ncbi:MAG: alpha/beta hydrolase [Acetobacteraceae bacterium]